MLSKLINAVPGGFVGRLMITLANAGARNRTPFERVSRYLVSKVFVVPKEDDFMADPLVDNDMGFDVDEIRAYRNKGS